VMITLIVARRRTGSMNGTLPIVVIYQKVILASMIINVTLVVVNPMTTMIRMNAHNFIFKF
jgi:hypothetical protein